MMARFLHLVRLELRAHRLVLGLWTAGIALAALTQVRGLHMVSWIPWETLWSFLSAFESWRWLLGMALAAWMVVADGLNPTPTAFWDTRPTRAGERMVALGFVCLLMLAVVPGLSAFAAMKASGLGMGLALHSGIAMALLSAGRAAAGFALGFLWPAPGRRLWMALPFAGSFIGGMVWSWLGKDASLDDSDGTLFWTGCLAFAVLGLPLALRLRRSLWPLGITSLILAGSSWLLAPLDAAIWKEPSHTAQQAGLPPMKAVLRPGAAEIENDGRTGKPRAVKLHLNAELPGLPSRYAAVVENLQATLRSSHGKVPHGEFESQGPLQAHWFPALTETLGMSGQDFPAEWRAVDDRMTLEVPWKQWTQLQDDEPVEITGSLRVKLCWLQKEWSGTYEVDGLGQKVIPLHGALLSQTGGTGVHLDRGWTTQILAALDPTPAGQMLSGRTDYCLCFQPDSRRSRAWASAEPGSTWIQKPYSIWNTPLTTGQEIFTPPGVKDWPGQNGRGFEHLPTILVSVAQADIIRVPLEPVVVTKRQLSTARRAAKP